MTGTLYRAEPASDLVIRSLEDVTLLYHRRSGQTHLVVSPVPEMLSVFEGGDVLTPADILARLSVAYDLGDSAEALSAITTHLEELAGLGLIHRA